MCSTSLLLILCYDPRKVRPVDLSMSLQTATKLSIMKSESKKEKKTKRRKNNSIDVCGIYQQNTKANSALENSIKVNRNQHRKYIF